MAIAKAERLMNLALCLLGTRRPLSKRELLGMEIRARETLYGEFIRECSKLVLDSFTHTLDKAEKLLPIYELLNRIRLFLVVRISSFSPFTPPSRRVQRFQAAA